MIITSPYISEVYSIIYTDPPWKQQKGNIRKCRPKQQKSFDYQTMSLDDCFEIQRPFFELGTEKHNVFMWVIDKYLHDAEQKMNELGYVLHARIIWDKGNGIAPAFTVRFSHEYLLWFYPKGRMLMPRRECRGKYTTVIREPSTYHSKKPLRAYEMIEDMFDGNKLELFARNTRIGWDSFGDELT
ncbi:MAG: S-adenosylmethionine-binding domain-containing protein [Ruminococcus sp.]|nr:S-adenosylmethionine-binding domain-containing protein [Ruminococcus sp.]